MTKIALLVLTLISVFTLSAQKKEPATLEETIDYLSQKSKEIIGYTKMSISQKVFINKKVIGDGHVKKTANSVEIFTSYKTEADATVNSTVFNPKHIVSIVNNSNETVSSESSVGTLNIIFIGKVALNNIEGKTTTVDKITFNFLQSDPDNAKWITNAFMHLKKLYKIEDINFE